ncbi:MAG TPA: helix-turn-helix transcriptional regulator [Streptosporangiaceae bacterium]|nr:helix-turn-helix transcriptional regulator [Streptosporangiaceae bacterium]
MLESLIERGGYSRNRKKILRALEISAAALSQYVREQTRPSFGKLLAIAEFFDVSLDYLVYGSPTGSLIDYGPLYRYVDHALADVQARGSRHSAVAARIGRVLADRINDVAAELAAAPTATREGLLQDDEMLRLERYCRTADILSLDLEFDVIHLEEGIAAGRFLPVVAANLERGAEYRFLIPGPDRAMETTVEACRHLLADQVGGDRVRQSCAFRRTAAPLLSGVVLLKLDPVGLRAEEPALYWQISDYLSDDGWLGCVIRPNNDSNSDMLMDPTHARRARTSFEALWSTAVTI